VTVARAAQAVVAAEPRLHDPGYYLIDDGREALEREIGYRVPLGRRIFRAALRIALPLYLGAIFLLTIGVLAVALLPNAVWRRCCFSGPDRSVGDPPGL